MNTLSDFFERIKGSGIANAYAFGGALRDWLFGRSFKDIDIAVPQTRLKQYVSLLSENFEPKYHGMHGALEVYRFYDSKSRTAFDIQPCSDIEHFLAHRDFSINSLAVELENASVFFADREAASRLIIDINQGLVDIQNGVIRHCYERAFDDDSIRILRGARYAAELGFRIDGDTAELAGKKAHLLADEKSERIVSEVLGGLKADPAGFLQALAKMGAWEELIDADILQAINTAERASAINKTASFSKKERHLFYIAILKACGFKRKVLSPGIFSERNLKAVEHIFTTVKNGSGKKICEILAASGYPGLVAAVLALLGKIEPEETTILKKIVLEARDKAGKDAVKCGLKRADDIGNFVKANAARQICEQLPNLS